MSLLTTYKYLVDHKLEQPELKLGVRPNTCYETVDLIEKIEADIAKYGVNQPCRLHYSYLEHSCVFDDYLIIGEDKLDKDSEYIETSLGHALNIFKLENEIVNDETDEMINIK